MKVFVSLAEMKSRCNKIRACICFMCSFASLNDLVPLVGPWWAVIARK